MESYIFGEKERGKVWKDYMERIMNKENDWDRNVEWAAEEGPVVCVRMEVMVQALNKWKEENPLSGDTTRF